MGFACYSNFPFPSYQDSTDECAVTVIWNGVLRVVPFGHKQTKVSWGSYSVALQSSSLEQASRQLVNVRCPSG